MFTIETRNPIHFQLDIQITHYDNIFQPEVLLHGKSPDWKFFVMRVTCC